MLTHTHMATKSADSCLMGRRVTSWHGGILRRGITSQLFSLIAISTSSSLASHWSTPVLLLTNQRSVFLRTQTGKVEIALPMIYCSVDHRPPGRAVVSKRGKRCLVWRSSSVFFFQAGWGERRGRRKLRTNQGTMLISIGATSQTMRTSMTMSLLNKREKVLATFMIMFLLNPSHFRQHSKERPCLKTSTAFWEVNNRPDNRAAIKRIQRWAEWWLRRTLN